MPRSCGRLPTAVPGCCSILAALVAWPGVAAQEASSAGVLGGLHFGGDDDCELAPRTVVDWPLLRSALATAALRTGSDVQTNAAARAVSTAEPLLQRVRENAEVAKQECRLGWLVACLDAVVPENLAAAQGCLEGMTLVRLLASRWPIFAQLRDLQERVGGSMGSCDDTYHPSLVWLQFRLETEAFVNVVPPWLAGLTYHNDMPPDFNQALGSSGGVVWKASSAAVTEGRAVSDWTADCAMGILAANILRSLSVTLGDSDAYRIVQRQMEHAEKMMTVVEFGLSSNWPIFALLHIMQLSKKTAHDMRLYAEDLMPLSPSHRREAERSEVWRQAAQVLRGAAAGSAAAPSRPDKAVMMTVLPHWRIHFLYSFFKKAHDLGFLSAVVIAPLLSNVTESCQNVVEVFTVSRRPKDVAADWSPCLPFVSQYPERVQFIFVLLALQLGITVLWFDFNIIWIQNPWPHLREAGGRALLLSPSYKSVCEELCPAREAADIYTVDELYARKRARPGLFLALPTAPSVRWMTELLQWHCMFPFGRSTAGFQFLLRPLELDSVPSVSYLPGADDAPPLRSAELDVEQKFVSSDGWYGDVSYIVSFEVHGYLEETEREKLLDTLFDGSAEDTRKILLASRKMRSPKRPTERLWRQGVSAFAKRGEDVCPWRLERNSFIGGYVDDRDEELFVSAEDAKCRCLELRSACAGVTCDRASGSCTLRRGEPLLAASPYDEDSYLKICSADGCDAPPVERVVHVNFADGCCEAEQKQSSETALQLGADETRPLRGDFLDADFRRRNHHLLTFNRTPELTKHKTPTGKIGYYVWKPYVVLQTVKDPSLPWDTTVIAWTDAGIHFVGDMRPLIDKYLRQSDVAATRTPMMEGDFSKRDAFILLDADYKSIIETSQVATGFILVRKTRLAVEFLQRWLEACEDPRIMTEEPSILGYPDYFTYQNNNDDQTAFSILFKKYGFHAFSTSERDSVVYTGRNLAKFIKASDDFATGRTVDRDAYLKAADSRAEESLLNDSSRPDIRDGSDPAQALGKAMDSMTQSEQLRRR
eukprot:TRINITY_DN81344_c0_g1_i1.p1 TRINITY_DN81344_c0_g1~~TRINITY_DN81344_c0_g1_i1.p1  ORF type:complete len:1047 (+),score=215.37 TRINITY_DN81344_c0_g1_i1:117-3257(+)